MGRNAYVDIIIYLYWSYTFGLTRVVDSFISLKVPGILFNYEKLHMANRGL